MSTLIPVLTAYEKEHVFERQALPDRYVGLSDAEMDVRIAAAKRTLGRRLIILGHHYQRDEVIKFADYTGDSYKLAQQVSRHPDAEFIVFCGVHSMADMVEPGQLEMCWSDLEAMGVIGPTPQPTASGLRGVIPVTYINSAAAI